MNNFHHKKIGIWGFGIVGKSALTYFDQQKVEAIHILNTKEIEIPATQTPTSAMIQTEQSIQSFLQDNDFILASPGIPLHKYQEFKNKFVNELDILQEHAINSIIAITGTVGKTSITHLLEKIIKQSHTNTIAAGNIGYPMLNLISQPSPCTKNTTDKQVAILELSSFQLQPIQKFAPDIAIITNFFPNHLDHHQSIKEYFIAKCNILKYQNNNQLALIPLNLIAQITQIIPIKNNWILFSETKPTNNILEKYDEYQIYYLENRLIYRTNNKQTQQLFDCSTLPSLTFDTNWLVIIAACNLYEIDLTTILPTVQDLMIPDHRVQKVGSWQGSNFYNDSKSTVWQATLQAVQSMGNKPIKLFLGGLSKGADRTPLLQALTSKNIEIYAFGKEANQLAQLCAQFNITHHAHPTLDASWQTCLTNLTSPHEVLFSPGGSSFDLFSNYKARGQYFTSLVNNICKPSQN